LLLAVSTAGGSDSLRVQVWRRLRGLGALYLQQSVCLLPDRPEVSKSVWRLAAKVRSEGGTARCLHLRMTDSAEQDGVVQQMQAAINEEYAEVLERLPTFFAELEMETARGRATFAEVEESEADLARFEAWHAKIEKRDYFDADLGSQVRAELDRARQALATFEAAALAADTASAPAVTSSAPRPHALPEA